MKRIIEYLVRRYNKKAKPQDRIMVTKPVVYEAKRTSTISVKRFKDEEPDFYRNIVKEKQYDLRQELIERIWKEGHIHSTIEETDNELKISLTIDIYGKNN